MKKIKATFLFLHFQHPSLENEIIKPLKKIYRQSGTIREVQLLRDALEKFRRAKNTPGKENLMDELDKLERKVEKKFQKRFGEAGEDGLQHLKSEMLSANKKSEKQESSNYFKDKINNILLLIQKAGLSNDDYHDLRKKLKELKYNLVLADEETKKLVIRVFTKRQLERWEEALGAWHDQVIIVERLKNMLAKQDIDPGRSDLINAVIQRANLVAERLIQRINKQLGAGLAGCFMKGTLSGTGLAGFKD